mmetsp:Transcript_3644/g.9555  ORF Transcript_3644/g.9555 Transcript_3644/m.9555 type:complete len:356 (+) Transcript_3644:371-1438(+)
MVLVKDGVDGSSESRGSPPQRNGDAESNRNDDGDDDDPRCWWRRSLHAAVKGGASGSIAMFLQVPLLMWLRTIVNYQYRYGVDASTAVRTLYAEGGIRRFYRGAFVALLSGPVARFGDTASNEGVRELFSNSNSNSKHHQRRGRVPVWAVTLAASVVASLWRVAITPLDTLKTTLQVGSADGWHLLRRKTAEHGIGVLWDGALGNSLATLAGHYPWWVVHNFLDARLPSPRRRSSNDDDDDQRARILLLLRRALIGFCSSVVSDCVSNGIRVIKTYQQTAPEPITYEKAVSELLAANGLLFLVRGLRLKILSNGLSGILFAVLWKVILDKLNRKQQQQRERRRSSTSDSEKPKRS